MASSEISYFIVARRCGNKNICIKKVSGEIPIMASKRKTKGRNKITRLWSRLKTIFRPYTSSLSNGGNFSSFSLITRYMTFTFYKGNSKTCYGLFKLFGFRFLLLGTINYCCISLDGIWDKLTQFFYFGKGGKHAW